MSCVLMMTYEKRQERREKVAFKVSISLDSLFKERKEKVLLVQA